MWDVQDVECWDVGCSGCGMFGMWDVGCGMFAGMWDVDLRNASQEGSLDRALLAAKLEFPKILVLRLSQHASDLKVECAGLCRKSEWSKQLYFGALIHLNFIILILICF